VTVIVNGVPIDDAAIEREAERLQPDYLRYIEQSGSPMDERALLAQLLDWAEENLIEAELLRQAERADPVELPDTLVEGAMREIEASYGGREKFEQCMAVAPENLDRLRDDIVAGMRTGRFIERLTAGVPAPEREDIERAYRDAPERWRAPELIRARHIVKNAADGLDDDAMREPLERAKAELDGGADFADVADRYSDCAGNGGDLGTFARGQMVESFERVVCAMRPGEVSDLFPTEFGWHIAQLIDRTPARTLPLEEVREALAEMLMEEKRRAAVERFIDDLKARATIVRAGAEPPVGA
jgi:parvulin-like peptidyl-prolyl isomerase